MQTSNPTDTTTLMNALAHYITSGNIDGPELTRAELLHAWYQGRLKGFEQEARNRANCQHCED